MKLHFFVALTLVALAILPATAVAQDTNVSVEVPGSDNSTQQECTETVDETLAICSAQLDGDTVVLDLLSTETQRVTLTEAMRTSGELSRQTFTISEGRNTLRFEMTQAVGSGDVGVTIDNGDVLYGKIVEKNNPLIGGPWRASDAQAAGLGGALSVSLSTFVLVLRRLRGDDTNTERVA
ncbi:hypothetical protein [Halobellus ordinarius]|uniref:hypothetical protein n=1 Tax=Halobellus ordinarius TaxID=3075120 RepID=UPI0028800E0A|nr:hypothetical protein [Halobellus sp. ZY16]